MKGTLFIIFMITLLIAVVMTALGLLIQWGVIQTSLDVSSKKELPFLGSLVTGVVLAIVALSIELGRRWFIVKRVKDEINDACLRLIGAAVVLPTTKQDECTTNYSYVTEYLRENVSLSSDEVKELLSSSVDSAIRDMMNVRYGGASNLHELSEILQKKT